MIFLNNRSHGRNGLLLLSSTGVLHCLASPLDENSQISANLLKNLTFTDTLSAPPADQNITTGIDKDDDITTLT